MHVSLHNIILSLKLANCGSYSLLMSANEDDMKLNMKHTFCVCLDTFCVHYYNIQNK